MGRITVFCTMMVIWRIFTSHNEVKDYLKQTKSKKFQWKKAKVNHSLSKYEVCSYNLKIVSRNCIFLSYALANQKSGRPHKSTFFLTCDFTKKNHESNNQSLKKRLGCLSSFDIAIGTQERPPRNMN